MSSYQKRVKERDEALAEAARLRKELYAKGNVFWQEHRCLGVGKMVMGTVVDGKTVVLHERPAK